MIYERARPRHVELLTRGVLLLSAFDIAIDPIEQAAQLPLDWFKPVGLWQLVPRGLLALLFNSQVLGGLRLLTVLGLVAAALVLPSRRYLALPSCFLVVLCSSFGRGLGHINHAQLPLLFVTCFLSVVATVPWKKDRWADPFDRPNSAALFTAVALLMSFFYAGIGLYRLGQSGVHAYLGDAMRYYSASNLLRSGYFNFPFGRYILASDVILVLTNLGYAVVTVGEITAPWAHRRRSFALVWSLTMIGFHLTVFFTMNILFFHNIILLVLLYLWPLTWKDKLQASPAPEHGQRTVQLRTSE